MIHWLLTRMEENPNAVFYGKELEEQFPESIQQATKDRVLRRIETPTDGASYSLGLNVPSLVVADQGGLEAIDEDNPETDPIPLFPDDLARYTLDLETFAKAVQQVNQLTGKPASLTDRLFFLGESERDGVLSSYVLALINDSPSTHQILAGLPSLLSKTYRRIMVACPSRVPTPTYRRQLEDLGIRVALLQPDNLLVLPAFDELWEDTTPSFKHSDNYHSVQWLGKQFTLTRRQAQVIKMLHQSHRMGTPELSWEQIEPRLNSINFYPTRMSDVFKRSPIWNTLVIRVGRGIYRLNL